MSTASKDVISQSLKELTNPMVEICKGKKLAYAKNKREAHGTKGTSKQGHTAMQGIN